LTNDRTKVRKTRVVLAVMGLDGHDFALQYVSHILRNAGFEIVYLGAFQTVESTFNTAIQEDADAIGLSCHSWEYIHYLPQLLALIEQRALGIPVVVGGGILTEQDEAELKNMGVAAVFRGGATAEEIVARVEEAVKQKLLAKE
jgi:methylmalonyl-CoA mutase C-terminal domain/subunit